MPNPKIHWVNDHTEICDRIPMMMRDSQVLVKLQTTDYLIYAELDKTVGIEEPDPRQDVLRDLT